MLNVCVDYGSRLEVNSLGSDAVHVLVEFSGASE